MPTIIPIHHSGHSRPMTEEEGKVMLGVFIVLSILFILVSIVSIVKYNKIGYKFYNFIDFYFLEDNIISIVIKVIMLITYGIILLVYTGSLIAKLL